MRESEDDINKDTVVAFANDIEGVDGEYRATLDSFTITKELKAEILASIANALCMGNQSPFIVLLPISMIEDGGKIKNFTYPITLFGSKILLVPDIREILVYEYEDGA